MFTNNLNPVLFSIGPLEIRYYGLGYVLGFLLTYWILYKAVDSGKIKNLTKKGVDDFITWAVVGVVLGGRLGYFLFYSPSTFFQAPLEILKIWTGGMSFHGGLIGIILTTIYFCRKNKISFYQLSDVVSIPALIAFGIVRLANFINGEVVGYVTNLPWCVEFKNYDGCRHPAQIYLALKNFAAAGLLYYFDKKERKPGFLFWNMILWYGIGRFIIEFVRVEERILGISTGQYLTLVMIIISIVFLYKNYRKVK